MDKAEEKFLGGQSDNLIGKVNKANVIQNRGVKIPANWHYYLVTGQPL